MSRVFVKGISAQTSCEDLRSLFSKLCPVSEVYIPGPTETTLRRNFAIVTLEGGEEEVKKCVKSFNSSIWKGSKLHVELAKEWYKERIAKEKEEQLDYEYSLQLQSQAVLEPVVYPPLSKETIALRRIRLQELPVVISMKPSSKRVKPNPKQRKPVVPCGIKIVFDDDILNHDHLTSSDDDTDSGSDADNEMKVIGDSSTRDKSIDMKATGAPCDTAAPSEVVSIINKLNSGEMKAIGGGIRKGFGSITVPAVPIVTAPASKADVSASTASTTPGNKYTSTSKLRGDVSCCIEENELSIPAHLLDEEESGDDEPCITEEDLQPEALSRERQRALELFGNMQFGPEATTIKPLKAPKETKGKAVTADVAASKGGAAKAAEAAETLTKEAKKVNFVAENEVREIPQEEGAARQASTLSAEEQETLDILNELKANANKPHPSAVAPTSSAVNADHQDTQKQVQQDEKVQEAAKVNPEAEVETEDILAVKDGYANMNQLKNIFYREVSNTGNLVLVTHSSLFPLSPSVMFTSLA